MRAAPGARGSPGAACGCGGRILEAEARGLAAVPGLKSPAGAGCEKKFRQEGDY